LNLTFIVDVVIQGNILYSTPGHVCSEELKLTDNTGALVSS